MPELQSSRSRLSAKDETESFRFRTISWMELQYDLKTLWGSSPDVAGTYDDLRDTDHLRFAPGKTTQLQFSDVSRLIKFFMLALPRDKQRVCENPARLPQVFLCPEAL